jgi:hypothetical protein
MLLGKQKHIYRVVVAVLLLSMIIFCEHKGRRRISADHVDYRLQFDVRMGCDVQFTSIQRPTYIYDLLSFKLEE